MGNSPINFSDPTGHMRLGECGLHGEDCSGSGSPTIPTDPLGSGDGGKNDDDGGDSVTKSEYFPAAPHDHYYGYYEFNSGYIDYLFDPFHGLSLDNRMFLIEAKLVLYDGRLLQIVLIECKMNNCNNPVVGFDNLRGNSSAKGQMASYLYSQSVDIPTQLFMGRVGADPFSRNSMNFEPSWVDAVQQVRPRELLLAKRDFVSLYNINPEIYQAIEEGVSLFGQ